ncbi:hypothetical protein [Sphingobium lactosutens]|uniref:Peptidoglycan polymerase n=1 Tax=Sphingobium lactosutens DS20 TaxID=1331060 RepID=T0HER7_9SPHN|nr:hypothetical protein [Sphingobium lactosutens]EQB10618.1 hypothetical protein RLDS_26925 [Sphingobium lactosutens DS20]
MSAGLRRGLTDLACRALLAALPPALKSWGWAVRCEAASIPDDSRALLFALHSLCGLMPRAIALQLFRPFAALCGRADPLSERSTAMLLLGAAMHRPRALGMGCAIGAVALGLYYLAIAGAPMRYIGINAGALVIGLAMLGLFGRAVTARHPWAGGAIFAMAVALLATALFGSPVGGAARWVSVGGFAIQPSLILLPVMLLIFGQTRGSWATAGIVVAAAAMALQPDRAMAAMLASCLAVLMVTRRDRHSIIASVASVISLAATFLRIDTLPAVPYVDRILYSSFEIHMAAGLAVSGGLVLLLIPAIAGVRRDPEYRATYAVFAAIWFVAIMAAGLGNYPTPVVGYGGSAIIGYLLSLLALPGRADVTAPAHSRTGSATDDLSSDGQLRLALA